MTTAKWISIQGGAGGFSRYLAARFNEKECLQVWAGDALREECLQFWGWRSSSNRVSEKNMHLD
jgi:hypothetical protein